MIPRMPDQPPFSDWLRQAMKLRGLTQASTADLLAVSRQAVGTWLKGTRPSPRHIARIKHKLGDEASRSSRLSAETNADDGTRRDAQIVEGAVNYFTTLRAASKLYDPLVEAYEEMRRDGEQRAALARDMLRELSRRWHVQVGQIQEATLERKDLPTSTSHFTDTAMQIPNLSELLNEVRTMTTNAGERKALAESIGVSQPQLSRWLSLQRDAAYSPSAANALKLLKWVTREREARQKRNPEGALTPPGPVTQLRKSSHEKPKSDQKKASHKGAKRTTKKR